MGYQKLFCHEPLIRSRLQDVIHFAPPCLPIDSLSLPQLTLPNPFLFAGSMQLIEVT